MTFKNRRPSRRKTAVSALVVVACVLGRSQAAGQETLNWILERGTTIGSASAAPSDSEATLTRVGRVLVHEGKLLVTQPREDIVRVFTEDGDFITRLGGPGEGPGEFGSVGRMGTRGDLIWVSDSQLRRIQHFAPNLEFVSSTQLAPHPTQPSGTPYVYSFLEDGSAHIQYNLGAAEEAVEPYRPQYVVRVGRSGMLLDTVTVISGRSQTAVLREGLRSGINYFVPLPVFDQSLFAAASDGSGAVVVHRSAASNRDRHTYRVVRFNEWADTLWTEEFSYDPVAVPDAWIEDLVGEWMESVSAGGPVEDLVAYRRGLTELFGSVPFFPAIDRVLAGEAGTTWLRARRGLESFQWEVLDASGRLLGRFTPPGDGTLVWAGLEAVWFLEHDDLEIPYLVRYKVHGPAPGAGT